MIKYNNSLVTQKNREFKAYFNEFMTWAWDTGYNEQGLISKLEEGMRIELRTVMATVVRSDSLNKLAAKLNDVDTNMRLAGSYFSNNRYTVVRS